MTIGKRLTAAALAVSLGVVGVGCGGDSNDDAADKLAEKIAESQGAGDVDIDSDSGKIKITDDEGNESEIDTSGSAKLPDDWPADLAVPDSIKLISSNTTTSDGKKSMSISGQTNADAESIFEELKKTISDAGFDIAFESSGTDYSSISGDSATASVNASVVTNTSEDGQLLVTLIYAAK